MQGAERREVVQATPAEGVANRAARPGVQMRYAKTPMAAAEVGRGAATLAMLAEKAQPAVQALHMQTMREDYLKGQMQFTQGQTYQQIRETGASYATVSGAAALQAQTAMNNAFVEGLSAIDKEDHRLTPEQYSEKLGEMSKSLFTGDQIIDDFMTELVTPNVQKLAGAQVKAHEEWKVQETKSAQRDVFLSLANMQDAESDKTLTGMLGTKHGDTWVYDGPIQGLNPADQKGTILESAVLALKQGNSKIFERLGGMQGIRDRFSTTAAEESAVLSAVSELAEKKENEWSEGLWKDNFANVRAVRTGAITPEQGLENAQAIAQKWGKGNKTMRALAENVWGAGNAYLNKMEARAQSQYDKQLRDLERAQIKEEEAREIQAEAARAVAGGYIPLLDTKQRRAALQQIQAGIITDIQAETKAGAEYTGGLEAEMAKRYATALDTHGIVDGDSAALWTANMSSLNIMTDGKVAESSVAAFQQLHALYKLNPGLAMNHLKSENAKDMFKFAADLVEFGDDPDVALARASASLKDSITPGDVKAQVNSTKFQEQLKAGFVERIEAETPGLIFGTKRGSTLHVSDKEVIRAATDRKILNRLTRAASAKMTSNTSLTEPQAISLVLDDQRKRGAYVLGSWLTPKQGTINEVMGLKDYESESGVPMEALTEYLAVNGPKTYGRQWFDTTMIKPGYSWSGTLGNWVSTKLDDVTRSVPEVHVQLGSDGGEPAFFVAPILNDGNPAQVQMIIKATDVGAFYKQMRKDYDTDRLPYNTAPWMYELQLGEE